MVTGGIVPDEGTTSEAAEPSPGAYKLYTPTQDEIRDLIAQSVAPGNSGWRVRSEDISSVDEIRPKPQWVQRVRRSDGDLVVKQQGRINADGSVKDSAEAFDTAQHEAEMLEAFGLRDVFFHQARRLVGCEHIDGPDLSAFTKDTSTYPLPNAAACTLMRNIVMDLQRLHDTEGVVQGDVRPHNIMLRDTRPDRMTTVFIDGENAYRRGNRKQTTTAISIPYSDRDTILTGFNTERGDVFGIGLSFYEIVTGGRYFFRDLCEYKGEAIKRDVVVKLLVDLQPKDVLDVLLFNVPSEYHPILTALILDRDLAKAKNAIDAIADSELDAILHYQG